MKKAQIAEEFFKSLENPQETMAIMLDRMDVQTLYIINNYSELIAKIKDRTSLAEKDIISCSIIIGYLLKSHLDRHELEETFCI